MSLPSALWLANLPCDVQISDGAPDCIFLARLLNDTGGPHSCGLSACRVLGALVANTYLIIKMDVYVETSERANCDFNLPTLSLCLLQVLDIIMRFDS